MTNRKCVHKVLLRQIYHRWFGVARRIVKPPILLFVALGSLERRRVFRCMFVVAAVAIVVIIVIVVVVVVVAAVPVPIVSRVVAIFSVPLAMLALGGRFLARVP